jgi:hypothetical protein
MTRPHSTVMYAGDEPILSRGDCLRIMNGELTRDQISELFAHRRRLAAVTLKEVAELYIDDHDLRGSDRASALVRRIRIGRVSLTCELRILDWRSDHLGDFPVLVAEDEDFREWLSQTRWRQVIREAGRIILNRIVWHYWERGAE